MAANLAILLAVSGFVATHRSSGTAASQASVAAESVHSTASPLDQLSSADIAANVAEITALPEAVQVNSQAQSFNVELTSNTQASEDSVVAKPQIVSTDIKTNKDIVKYTSVAGDTLTSLAQKFGVTSDSIRWSNSLTAEKVPAGKELVIPPAGVNGIVYTVKVGDTVDSLAKKYSADQAKLVAFNDAEIAGIKAGQLIIIPDAVQPAATSNTVARTASASFNWTSNYTPVYGSNGYSYGWCTWYVASRIQVPNNWGNANTWDNYAARSGWTVSSVPVVGAIGQTDGGGLGHVGIVEAVSDDGTQIKYSDMNGIAGWGRVGYSGWVSVHSPFQHFIYR